MFEREKPDLFKTKSNKPTQKDSIIMASVSLFNYDKHRNELLVPNRPLREVSDFVIEQMPEMLEEIKCQKGKIHKLESDVALLMKRVDSFMIARILADVQGSDLAAFDVKMTEAAIVHSGGKPPERLVTIVDALAEATDLLPIITYEDLIFINPSEDRRTFTSGDMKQTEADFYEGHRIIEGHMDEVLKHFLRAINELSKYREESVDTVNTILKQSLDCLLPALGYMEIFEKEMLKEHFKVFRNYLSTNPVRRMKGASGAFYATIPTADLLLGGENLAEDHLNYLRQHIAYFPRKGRKDINRALTNVLYGLTLNGLYKAIGKPKVLGSTLRELSGALQKFRGKHYRAILAQHPDILADVAVGTSGEMGEFLRERLQIKHIR